MWGLLNILGSILTNDGRRTCEIKCRISRGKAAFNKKRALFTSILDLNFRKKLVKCYIWSWLVFDAKFSLALYCQPTHSNPDIIDTDIFVNCNWVDTRWQ